MYATRSVPFASHESCENCFSSGGAPIASSETARASPEKTTELLASVICPSASYRQSRVE